MKHTAVVSSWFKCQLPGPQQGTDRESQKPQFGKQSLASQIFDSTRENLTEDEV